MQIEFNLPHVFLPGSPSEDNALALRALLDCLTRINLAYLRNHSVPTLYRSGVVYGRTKVWEPIPAVMQRGYGDCKSLTAWLVAEYARRGISTKPVFRFNPRPDGSGAIDFHILVLLPDGKFEDPSKVLGMGHNEVAKIRG